MRNTPSNGVRSVARGDPFAGVTFFPRSWCRGEGPRLPGTLSGNRSGIVSWNDSIVQFQRQFSLISRNRRHMRHIRPRSPRPICSATLIFIRGNARRAGAEIAPPCLAPPWHHASNMRRHLTRTPTLRSLALLTLLVATSILPGCATPFETPELVRAHSTSDLRRPRSLSLDAPPLRRALADADRAGTLDAMPWYLSRADARPTIIDGVVGPTLELSQTITWDHQQTSGNSVRDYYYQSTWRSRTTQTAR